MSLLKQFGALAKNTSRPSLSPTYLEDGFYRFKPINIDTKDWNKDGQEGTSLTIECELAEEAKTRPDEKGKTQIKKPGDIKITHRIGLTPGDRRTEDDINKGLWAVWASVFDESDEEYKKYARAIEEDTYVNVILQSGKPLYVSYTVKPKDQFPLNVFVRTRKEYEKGKIQGK